MSSINSSTSSITSFNSLTPDQQKTYLQIVGFGVPHQQALNIISQLPVTIAGSSASLPVPPIDQSFLAPIVQSSGPPISQSSVAPIIQASVAPLIQSPVTPIQETPGAIVDSIANLQDIIMDNSTDQSSSSANLSSADSPPITPPPAPTDQEDIEVTPRQIHPVSKKRNWDQSAEGMSHLSNPIDYSIYAHFVLSRRSCSCSECGFQ
jgi:hypothetical protein